MTRWEKPSGFHLAVYLSYSWWKKYCTTWDATKGLDTGIKPTFHPKWCRIFSINSISQLHIWYQNHNRQIHFTLKFISTVSLWFLGIPRIFSSFNKGKHIIPKLLSSPQITGDFIAGISHHIQEQSRDCCSLHSFLRKGKVVIWKTSSFHPNQSGHITHEQPIPKDPDPSLEEDWGFQSRIGM